MPNWCSTNYAVRGDRKELQEFCDIVNKMPDHETDFGRLWLGNFFIALGYAEDDVRFGRGEHPVRCRGAFNANPDAPACFCGPQGDENEMLEIGEDGILRFSTETAYSQCLDLEAEMRKRWPSMELAYKTTDEFGNFHNRHDPEGFGGFPKYEIEVIDDDIYEFDDFEKFRSKLISVSEGFDIKPDISEKELLSDEFVNRFCQWREGSEKREIGFVIYVDE